MLGHHAMNNISFVLILRGAGGWLNQRDIHTRQNPSSSYRAWILGYGYVTAIIRKATTLGVPGLKFHPVTCFGMEENGREKEIKTLTFYLIDSRQIITR